MSDLTATGCGCNTPSANNTGWGCSSIIWIILLLSCCGGCGGCGNNGGFLSGNSDNGCGCDFIWIILLLFLCGGNNGCGNNSCGCGC